MDFAAGELYGTGANRSVSYGGVHERLTSDKRAYQQTCSSLKNGQDGSQAYTPTLAPTAGDAGEVCVSELCV